MELNTTKTKEMILGPINKTELPRLTTPAGTIERVNTFKLLGVHIESSLSWLTHISNILKKVTRRLYFLKQLKRAGLPSSHLLYYCTSVIRPVLEYCVPVWHYALTKEQTQQLEAIQNALSISFLTLSEGCRMHPCCTLQILIPWPLVEKISLKKIFRDITKPPPAYIIFYLVQESNLLFHG